MAEVTFPSPSLILDDSNSSFDPHCPTITPIDPVIPFKKANAGIRRKHTRCKSSQDGKPKQTKSRDGCITCKEKRLKCDETHPACNQCKRRKVECGGYKKTFTFRTVQKATFPQDRGSSRPRKRSGKPKSTPPIPKNTNDASINIISDEDPLPSSGLTPPVSASDPKPDGIEASSFPDEDFSDLTLLDGTRPCTPQIELCNELDTFRDEFDDMQFPLDLQDGAVSLDDIEEVLRPPDTIGRFPYPSPSPSQSPQLSCSPVSPITISLDPEFSGMLHRLFHERTCGILSIKNGPDENPWSTLLWPIIFDDPSLYYAMLSLTASHASSQFPELKVKGLEFMTASMELFRSNLSRMRCDTALATALILAFAESWHSHIYTGIMHLRGARNLIMQGLQHQDSYLDEEGLERLDFLRGTWVYMDVIARLTTLGGEDPEDLDCIVMPTYGPETVIHKIDPLMGCATTLFPLIGAVASLVKTVRKSAKTPLRIVAKAASLRDSIVKWQIPSQFVPPRDETLEIDHSRHTAEAYRWATVLYLYQSVPMICTQEPSELAELTLRHLAAVPIASRATIIHIFPLLAAGCEATSDDDRAFVAERWEKMIERMCIGNLDRCWDVVKEVWERRDDLVERSIPASPRRASSHGEREEAEEIKTCSLKNMARRISMPSNERSKEQGPGNMVKIDPRFTVRGKLHWVAVMLERGWEILLG